jgi:hypothetical protein
MPAALLETKLHIPMNPGVAASKLTLVSAPAGFYAKLGVSARRAAVRRAHELNLS